MKYRTIVADPPWPYDGGFAFKNGSEYERRDLPYAAMDLEDIAALPIGDLADSDCRLFLWTTNRYLPDAFPLMLQWGFRYRQMLVWQKSNAQPGPGSVAILSAEFLLVGVRGFPRRLSKWPSAVVTAPRTTHSKKPEVFLDVIEATSPPPRLELFARRNRLGWDTWGNEAIEHVSLDIVSRDGLGSPS